MADGGTQNPQEAAQCLARLYSDLEYSEWYRSDDMVVVYQSDLRTLVSEFVKARTQPVAA
jgi:hypothetical protein